MTIKDKIFMDRQGLTENGPINIVAFGDSVTHGALKNEINYETVYWNLLRKKILEVKDYVPVNVINAGIGGICAKESIDRLESQVLCHRPDLIIICFGLNDVNGSLESYLASLKTIFEKCSASGSDVIFMTPNMLNTYVADDTRECDREYAAVTADFQNSGKMDLFMSSATDLANKMNIPVCDCYSKWKELSKTQDTTQLLINRVNHPTPEMHKLFADSLFDMIFEDMPEVTSQNISTMYNGNR